jgi:hypothetical protein
VAVNEIIRLLIDLPPANVEALALVDELLSLEGSPGPARLLEMQPRLNAAQEALRKISERSHTGVSRCLLAQAVPASKVPTGF